jgi:hypothetical protein
MNNLTIEKFSNLGLSYDAAFKIGITYIAMLVDMPWLRALFSVSYIASR